MVDFRSRNRNYFVLLALMLLLPITGAFAETFGTDFTVNVTDKSGQAIASAGVYIWDVNDSPYFNNNYKTWGLTGTDGVADLTLSGMVETTDSTSNPSPNIGILVMPPDGTEYAFKTKKILFLNVFKDGAQGPPVDIVLEQGCKVNFIPAYDDNPSDTTTDPVSGLVNAMNLAIPNVPATVKSISVNNSNLASGVYSMYWPANAGGNGTLSGDSKQWDYNVSRYYATQDFTFAAGDAGTEVTIPITHNAKPKGAFKVVEDPTVTDTNAWRQLHFGYTTIGDQYSSFQPDTNYWLPVGVYNFNYALNTYDVPAGSGFGAAKGIWNNVEITVEDTATAPETRTFTVGGGTGLTVELMLGENEADGDEASALSDTIVEVEKLVDFGGYQQWMGYESTPDPVDIVSKPGRAVGKLYHRLSSGKYRIKITYSSNYKQGVWDNNLNCFKYITTPEFEITSDVETAVTETIELPQVPGFKAEVNATLANGYSYSGSNPIRVGYLPEDDSANGYELNFSGWPNIYVDSADSSKYHIFVPFAQARDIVVMANLGDYSGADRPPLFKVFEPYTINLASGTQGPATAYVIDDSNFVELAGNVYLGDQTTNPYAGDARVDFNPLIPGTEIPANKVFRNNINWYYGVDQKGLKDDPGFQFATEINAPYSLEVVETVNTLSGFLPYKETGLQTAGVSNKIINLNLGGYFKGQLLNPDGSKPASVAAQITVAPESDYENSYDEPIMRSGFTKADGSFEVSGLKTGEHNVRINIDGPRDTSDTSKINYASQTMPILLRKVFVDAENPPVNSMEFTLDPTVIGYASGRFIDSVGEPIAGLKVAFVPGSIKDADWFNANAAVFFCVTDSEGYLTEPGNATRAVPLPAGEYQVWANGVLSSQHPASFSYDLGYYNYYDGIHSYGGKAVRGINIYAGQVSTIPEVKIDKRYKVNGVITEDNEPLDFVNFQVLNHLGEEVAWGYTNEVGSYTLQEGLKPGFYQFGLMVDDQTEKRFYLHPFEFDPESSLNENIALNSGSLVPVAVNTVDQNGDFLTGAPADLKLVGDPQNPESPQWYLTWLTSGNDGQINVKVPDLSTIPNLANSVYSFVPRPWKNYDGIEEVTLYPGAPINLDLYATEPQVVKWKSPVNVKVTVNNPPQNFSSNQVNYLGMLVRRDGFYGRGLSMHNEEEMCIDPEWFERNPFEYLTHSYDRQNIYFGRYETDGFVFNDVAPDEKYVFVAYEASRYLLKDDLEYFGYGDNVALYFRSFMDGIITGTTNSEVTANFGPVAPLTVDSSPDSTIIDDPVDVNVAFTPDQTLTSGKWGWPAVFISGEPAGINYPVQVQASRTYRISYRPHYQESPYLPKTDEDVFVPSTGKTHVMELKKPNYLSGMVTFNSNPVNGELVLVPVGANVFMKGFEPIEIEVREGQYKAPLAAGEYMGYMVPAQGAPKFVKLAMDKADMTFDIVLEPGVEVSGMVLDTAQSPVPGAAVMVLRKRIATGTIDDGSEFYPYPTFFGDNIVPCGPEGGYRFMAEKNVNYYLQAIAPEGFRPGMPMQVAVGDAAVTAPTLELRTGSRITGILAGPGRIMVRPAFKDALQGQISANGEFEVPVYNKDSNGDFSFVIPGLDPNVPYNLTIYPEPGPNGENYAIKRINYVFAGMDGYNLGEITFNLGFKVYGQLLDEEGSPLKMAGVPVNLAMTLPMTDSTLATNRRLNIRENVAQTVPEDVSLQDVTYEGLWVQTNDNGQFVFTGVPSFLSAFIKTEKGFSIDGIDYARARTEDFLNPIDGTGQTYEKNVTIPVGGQIIGRLIDSKGEPVTAGMIDAGFGDMWQEVHPDSNGKFTLSGLVPAPSYMLHVRGIPGRVPLFRAGISVEPGQITDLGSLPVVKAVRAKGKIKNLKYALQHFFAYGVDENSGLSVIAFDGDYEIKDNALLSRRFMQRIKGENELFWNSAEVASITEMPFEVFAGPGKTHLGMVFHTEDETGAQTLISWGWKPGITLPTESQLASEGVDVFDLTQNFGSIESEEAFGTIEGTLKHAIETDYEFFPENAVIALYPVVQNTDGSYKLKQVAFPTAVTNPVGGMWFVEGVPQGDYRIKVISSKYGTQFFKKIVTVGSEHVVEDLVLGASVAKITGKVVDENSEAVANAAVKLVLHEATAMTDSEGSFTFYRPLNEFVIPQLEIRKPGFATTRIIDVVTGVATYTDGFDLATDTYIGEFAIEGAAGNAVVKVTDANSGEPMIGAEVTMILEKATNIDAVEEGGDTSFTLFTPAAVQFADENGVCKFSSVPVGKEVRFRARNFYYKPEVASLTTTGADEIAITLTKAPPKVFYTGRVKPVEGSDPQQMTIDSTFDFNQVVVKNNLGMIFAGDTQTLTSSKFTYPDLMGGRLTNFRFTDTFTKANSVIATVTYEITSGVATSIGEFDVMAGFRFRREFEVDPLSEDGFAGRMTDENGNQLPTGLSVPPGYLPPEIDSFQLKVEDKPEGTPKGDDGEDLVDATFAGPTFEFTFNNSNFGGSTEESQSGLFEVTLEYEEGTKLEPRWQDGSGNWSKVGIIEDSIKWDHPEEGYVTFKVSHLTKFAVLANVASSTTAYSWDFDGDDAVTTKDFAVYAAWIQSRKSDDKSFVRDLARQISGNSTIEVSYLPENLDDLNADGKITTEDLGIAVSYIQTRRSTDYNFIQSFAESLMGVDKNLTPSVLPGEKVNR